MATYYDDPVPMEQCEAAGARWSELVDVVWPGVQIIWADGSYDYQGDATILGKLPSGDFLLAEWTYGSCSGCDGYEDLGGDDLHREFENCGEVFSAQVLGNYGRGLTNPSRASLSRIIADITVKELT